MSTSEIRIPETGAATERVPAPAEPKVSSPEIADPGPLGLGAFAATTFMLSVFNANLIHNSASLEGVVLPMALFYGGLGQLLAGMWEFRKGNTFGALAFSSYGAFWLSYWYLVDHVAGRIPATGLPNLHTALGLYLLTWTIFTAYMTIASLRSTGAVAAVFVALTVTFALLAIGAYSDHVGWTKAGGIAGIITAALAWYASFAGVTNATFARTILPVVPLNVARGTHGARA